ncbi:MAG: hypothetical protein AAGN35_21855 [Bacteroidota bacterium]
MEVSKTKRYLWPGLFLLLLAGCGDQISTTQLELRWISASIEAPSPQSHDAYMTDHLEVQVINLSTETQRLHVRKDWRKGQGPFILTLPKGEVTYGRHSGAAVETVAPGDSLLLHLSSYDHLTPDQIVQRKKDWIQQTLRYVPSSQLPDSVWKTELMVGSLTERKQ